MISLAWNSIRGWQIMILYRPLRPDDQLMEGLDDLSARQDSVVIAFNSYKSVLTRMDKSSYNQNLQTMEIKDFRSDGHAPADFYADKVMVWDYNYPAEESSETNKTEKCRLLFLKSIQLTVFHGQTCSGLTASLRILNSLFRPGRSILN